MFYLKHLQVFLFAALGFLPCLPAKALSPNTEHLTLKPFPSVFFRTTTLLTTNQCVVEEPNRPFPQPPEDTKNQVEILFQQMSTLSPYMAVRYEFQKIQEKQALLDQPVVSAIELQKLFEEGEVNEEANCSSVDLRSNFPGGVLNQGQSNWCFSYIAADLLSFYTGVVVSPNDLAISQHRRIRDMKRAQWESLPEKCRGDFSHDDSEIALGSGNLWKTLNIAIHDGACSWNRMPADKTSLLDKDFKILHKDFRENKFSDASLEIAQTYFTKIQLNDLQKAGEEKSFIDFLTALRNVSCEGEISLASGLKVGFFDPSDRSQYAPVMRRMENLLNQGTPLALGYGGQILWNNKLRDQPYSHTGTLVGRRFNRSKNQCEYLVRNTWGVDYKKYHSDYDSEQGHIWIPRDLFKTNLYGFAYLYR